MPRVRSCAIVTTTANDALRPLHDRMPVVLPEHAWSRWLDPDFRDTNVLHNLLGPAPSEDFEAWRVTSLVNVPDNNGPELLERVAVPSL